MALQFFGLAVTTFSLAIGITYSLMQILGRAETGSELSFPPAFAVSTLLLAVGSWSMDRSIRFVRVEKQLLFRKWLLIGLGFGVLFIGVQSYGLWAMFPADRSAEAASLGALGFVIALSTLHGLHFLVAVLFSSFVVAQSWNDRYDHEYYWGVWFCTWFWHGLGIVWIAILAIFAIAYI